MGDLPAEAQLPGDSFLSDEQFLGEALLKIPTLTGEAYVALVARAGAASIRCKKTYLLTKLWERQLKEKYSDEWVIAPHYQDFDFAIAGTYIYACEAYLSGDPDLNYNRSKSYDQFSNTRRAKDYIFNTIPEKDYQKWVVAIASYLTHENYRDRKFMDMLTQKYPKDTGLALFEVRTWMIHMGSLRDGTMKKPTHLVDNILSQEPKNVRAWYLKSIYCDPIQESTYLKKYIESPFDTIPWEVRRSLDRLAKL